MSVPYFPTVSWLEVLWLAVAVFGFLSTLRNLRDAIGDRAHVLRDGIEKAAPGELMISDGNIRRERFRLVSLTGCIALGLIAASLPGREPAPGQAVHWTTIASPLVLLVIETSLTWNSYADRRMRVAVLQLIAIMGYRVNHPKPAPPLDESP